MNTLNSVNGATGLYILLDMIPVVVIAILIIVFIVERHRFKTQERHLNQVIRTIEHQHAESNNESGKDQK